VADLPDVFLIVLDTLRKDFLPMYGGSTHTPNLEALARDSVVFQNAVAPAPWTVPTHISFISGLYAREHGVHEDEKEGGEHILEQMRAYDGPNLVERLRRKGYNAVGLSANQFMTPGSGFDRFFNVFTGWDYAPMIKTDTSVRQEATKYGTGRTEIVLSLLRRGEFGKLLEYYREYRRSHLSYQKELRAYKERGFPHLKAARQIVDALTSSSYERPLFAFMNFMEVHEPVTEWEVLQQNAVYEILDLLSGGRVLGEGLMREIREGYKRALEALDAQIGRLLDFLRKSGMYERSLIVVLSDHGQAMKEGGHYPYYGHGAFLYPELIEVPLIVKFPGNYKIRPNEGYQSLTAIPDFIEGVIDGAMRDAITGEVAVSEAFGSHINLRRWFEGGILPREMEGEAQRIFHSRKVLYKEGYKLVVDGTLGKIEEFKKGQTDVSQVDNREKLEDMLSELELFKGTERFIVPSKR
jgi:arylsulfatase A-like enzyme